MRTETATAVRRAHYEAAIRIALPHINAARKEGAKCARHLANYLNNHDVEPPHNSVWTESAVLRCLRRLKQLGLDQGSNPFWIARTRTPRVARRADAAALSRMSARLMEIQAAHDPGLIARRDVDDAYALHSV